MSMHTWITYGFGIQTDSVKYTASSVCDLIEMAPEVKDCFYRNLKEESLKITEDFDFDFYENGCGVRGLHAILADVMTECEGIEFVAVDDCDGNRYVMYPQLYPWQMSRAERYLTQDGLEEIFTKYLAVLDADNPKSVAIYHQQAENYG